MSDDKKIMKCILYVVIGLALGMLMQKMPQLRGEWSQNIFTYMASDLGIWAVICILIATYAKSAFEAGLHCFLCMAAMVAGYYILVPSTFLANLHWVVVAILIFPIGMITYGYRKKTWVMVVLELFLTASLLIQIITLKGMLASDYQMVVQNAEGLFVPVNATAFSLGNYVLLTACTVFGMLFLLVQYRKQKQRG